MHFDPDVKPEDLVELKTSQLLQTLGQRMSYFTRAIIEPDYPNPRPEQSRAAIIAEREKLKLDYQRRRAQHLIGCVGDARVILDELSDRCLAAEGAVLTALDEDADAISTRDPADPVMTPLVPYDEMEL